MMRLTIVAALICVIWGVSILSVVALGACLGRLSWRDGLLGAHLGVHGGREDEPSAWLRATQRSDGSVEQESG